MITDIEAHREEYEAEVRAKAEAAAAVVAEQQAAAAVIERKKDYDRAVRRLNEIPSESLKNRNRKLQWMQPVYDMLLLSAGADNVQLVVTTLPLKLSEIQSLQEGEEDQSVNRHLVSLVVKGITVDHWVSEQQEHTSSKWSSRPNGKTRFKIATGYHRPNRHGGRAEVVESFLERKDGGRDWRKMADTIESRVNLEIAAAKRVAMAKKNSTVVADIKTAFGITEYSSAVMASTDEEGKVVINLKEWYIKHIVCDASEASGIIDKLMAMGLKPGYGS